VLGEAADGNAVHAGFGDGAHGVQADVAGGFEQGAAGRAFDCAAHGVEIEIIEQDQLRTGRQRFVELVQRFHLDLHAHAVAGQPERRFQHRCDAAGRGDVVFLDQDAVVEPDALVLSAARAHRVFFGQAQAGQRLAGVEDGGARAGDGCDVRPGRRRHGRQGLQEIQRRPLGGEQCPGAALDLDQQVARCDRIALVHLPVEAAGRVQRAEAGVEPGPPGNHRRLARDDAGMGGLRGRKEAGGQVAAADVFRQRARYVGFHGRQQQIGHRRINSDKTG